MQYFSKENIILFLIVGLIIIKIVEFTQPKGMSKSEHEAWVKYEILEAKTKELLKENKKLEAIKNEF